MRILAACALVIAGIAGIVTAQKAQTKKDSQPATAAEPAKTRLLPEELEEKLAELDEQAAERDEKFAERDQELA
jgi:glutamine synthetase